MLPDEIETAKRTNCFTFGESRAPVLLCRHEFQPATQFNVYSIEAPLREALTTFINNQKVVPGTRLPLQPAVQDAAASWSSILRVARRQETFGKMWSASEYWFRDILLDVNAFAEKKSLQVLKQKSVSKSHVEVSRTMSNVTIPSIQV